MTHKQRKAVNIMKQDVCANEKWIESTLSPPIEIQADLAYPLYPGMSKVTVSEWEKLSHAFFIYVGPCKY